LSFRAKITTRGNDTYEVWCEGDHDDMVLALALSCWYGETTGSSFIIVQEPLEEGVFDIRIFCQYSHKRFRTRRKKEWFNPLIITIFAITSRFMKSNWDDNFIPK